MAQVNPMKSISNDQKVNIGDPGSNSLTINEAAAILDKSNQYLEISLRCDLSNIKFDFAILLLRPYRIIS